MKRQLSALSQLIEFAKVDNQLHPEEIKFIYSVGIQMGLSEKEILSVIKNPVAYSPFENETDRIVQFQRIALLMFVDGKINASEKNNVKKIGLKLGLNPQATSEVIKQMESAENNIVAPDVLLSIYMKYHN